VICAYIIQSTSLLSNSFCLCPQEKLAEMETQSQILASEHQKSFYDRQAKSSSFLDEAKSFLESTFEKEDATRKKNRLKQQFHERRTLSNPMGGHVT
jgi:hypothetical protein